jgi:hypothetical protein
MYKITGSITIALLFLLGACAKEPIPEVTETRAAAGSPAESTDAKLLKISKNLPGFGGMFFDDNGDLNIYLAEDVQNLSAASREERTTQAKAAIAAVFGEDFLTQGRSQRPRQSEKAPPSQSPRIILLKGDYEIGQLVEWQANMNRVLDLPGTVLTDLDERRNRVKVGIESSAPHKDVEAALDQLGIPRKAVVIEVTKPIKFQATLRSKFRSMPGGVQVEADTGVFAFKICTMGFNAIRSNVNGFVTNSHCTETQGDSEGTDFHQPDDPLFSGNKVGDEIADPTYSTGGACPSGRRCRFSDSAFIDYTISRGKDIARTTGWNNGSLTVSSSSPRLTIVGETSSWIDGSELDKIGRTTGWTYGRVNGTCQTINVEDSNVTLFCQHQVNRIPEQTHTMVDNGDSGSPVFRWLGSTVILSGILWGGPDDGSSFVFSPMDQIEQELGSLTTFNFPSPPPPPPQSCSGSEKCCGVVNPDGTCDGQCWPQNNPCP